MTKKGTWEELPAKYRILPASVDHLVPGHEEYAQGTMRTLALRERDCAEWFDCFVNELISACGKRFLPVCRMSDGEYLFMFGEQPPDPRLPFLQQVKSRVRKRLRSLRNFGRFNAWTGSLYHSGSYSAKERRLALPAYEHALKTISEKGILALHLTYGVPTFQERFHPAIASWWNRQGMRLTDDNFYPFYFVYTALTGLRRRELLANRRVLVVNGAVGEAREAIALGLRREGVASIDWVAISKKRSLFDQVDVSEHVGNVDLALVGAGIGKPHVLLQLERLQVPCIDAGYVFSVWEDPRNGLSRVHSRLLDLPPLTTG